METTAAFANNVVVAVAGDDETKASKADGVMQSIPASE